MNTITMSADIEALTEDALHELIDAALCALPEKSAFECVVEWADSYGHLPALMDAIYDRLATNEKDTAEEEAQT